METNKSQHISQKWRWFFSVAAAAPGKYSGEMETASPSEARHHIVARHDD